MSLPRPESCVSGADDPTSGDGLGPLERRVLDRVWAGLTPVSVRDVCSAFPDLAYTTVMTTLDRLHRKGVLDRTKDGRAYRYAARFSREHWVREVARRVLQPLLPHSGAPLRPVLSMFVDAVSERDAAALDELERLIHERRAATRTGDDA